MTVRILILVLVCALNVLAQNGVSVSNKPNPDKLLKYLSAAESHQRSGDLTNAAIENSAVLDIALERFGNIAIEEGKYVDAVKYLTGSLQFSDTSSKRTTLAIAYLRQNLYEKALAEAQVAVAMNPDHVGSRYILSNIYYTKEDYENALPELEWVFAKAPDFEIGRALGLTYLNLRKIKEARLHFKKLQDLTGGEKVGLHILFARFYERTTFPGDAERELKNALKLEPNRPKLNFYLGYLLMQHGGSERLHEAREYFAKELKLVPNDFYALFFSGVAATSQNKHKEAIPFLKKAIEVNPESGEAHLFLAQAQMGLEDLVKAEKNLRRAIALEATSKGKNTQARRTHFMLGRLLLKTGRKEEAKKELQIAAKLQKKSLDSSRDNVSRILGQVVESDKLKIDGEEKKGGNVEIKLKPERVAQLKKVKAFLTDIIAQSYNNLGVISTQFSQLDKAVKNFSDAYYWKPDFPNLARNFGIVSFRANNFKESIAPLSYHLEKNPQDVLIRKMLGSSFYFTKDYTKSVETLKPLEKQIHNDAELAYFYGISLAQLKRNREAIPVFNNLASISQNNAEALFYAAQGFMILGEFKRAIKEFKQVVKLSPTTQKANYFIGQSYIRLNRYAEAEKAFTKELENSPADALSKYHLALTLIERRTELDRAIKILEEAISLRYGYADAHYQLGKIYLEKGETLKAIEQLEKAVSADDKKDYIYYQLSIAYRKASRKKDAKKALETYQRLKKEKRDLKTPMPMGGNESPIPEGNK